MDYEQFRIEYEEGSFYDRLTEEEKQRFLLHMLTVKHRRLIHQVTYVYPSIRPEPFGRKPINEIRQRRADNVSWEGAP